MHSAAEDHNSNSLPLVAAPAATVSVYQQLPSLTLLSCAAAQAANALRGQISQQAFEQLDILLIDGKVAELSREI
jgi:hypothetical protein